MTTLEIKLFGIAREIIGQKTWELSVDQPITVKEFTEQLKIQYPDFARLQSILIAINNEYAQDGQVINAEDEIAIIPPVSGG